MLHEAADNPGRAFRSERQRILTMHRERIHFLIDHVGAVVFPFENPRVLEDRRTDFLIPVNVAEVADQIFNFLPLARRFRK